MAGSCECVDEYSVSIKCGEFLDQLRDSASEKEPCSMKLVSCLVGCLVGWLVGCLVIS